MHVNGQGGFAETAVSSRTLGGEQEADSTNQNLLAESPLDTSPALLLLLQVYCSASCVIWPIKPDPH